MIQMVLVLSALGSYVVVMSDEVNLIATIPPGYALQEYLCSGQLKSNTTVVLDDGEHRISSGPPCNISSDITITGSSMKNTAVRCEGEGSVLQFSSFQKLAIKRMTFISCGIQLVSIENTVISNCTFQSASGSMGQGAIQSESSTNIDITSCVFQNNSATAGGAVALVGSTGNVSITYCTFQNNSATTGGAVVVFESTGDVSITYCAFQNNSATAGGAVVVVFESKGDVSITYCTFQNNSATDGGGAVALGGSTGNVSITYCTFQNNSSTVGGAVFESKGDVSITYCTFQNNSATDGGGAVALGGSTGNVSITYCTFQNNSSTVGGAVFVLKGDVSITYCTFQNNSATVGGGAVELYESTGDISITNCTFQNNSVGGGCAEMFYGSKSNFSFTYCTLQNGAIGGGAVVVVESIGNVSITYCTFQNNSGTQRGGAVGVFVSTGDVSITYCTFQNNSATGGGAVMLYESFKLNMKNCIFTKNTAHYGSAVYVTNNANTPLSHLLLQDVVIKDNYCSGGGAIFFDGVKVEIFGNTPTGSQFSSNSAQGAIQGQNGLLQLHGNITFIENRGVNGGAISLSNNVPLYFYEGCRVEFYRNEAVRFGGAIYNDWGIKDPSIQSICVIRLVFLNQSTDFFQPTNNFSITFTGNHAQQGGHAVYATPIYNCKKICFRNDENLYTSVITCSKINLISYFTIIPLAEDINDTQVISPPAHVYLCGCSDYDPKLCNVTSHYQGKVTTYPGGTVRLNVTSLDDGNNLSPGVVYTQIDTSGITSQYIALGPRQEAQWIGIVCGTIEYQIYGPQMASFKLLLSNNPNNPPAVIEVELLPCEPGFTLSSTGVIKCECSLFFTSYGVVCDASDGTVTRSNTNWIGVYNNTLPALASTCPLDYCNSTMNKLSLGKPGDLCNGGRSGIVCGHCHGNHSVIFGSSKCQVCTNMWLITLVMFAVLGVLLVAALFFLNLTVTQGTLYGLIFYANIIQVNTSILFSQSILNPMKVIVSFVNLDLGLPLCFYDGMDDADKAGFQFVFSAYLLILTMTVIVLCHYCLQRSPTSYTSSCWYRFPIIIGERAVGVLSTLIYLSYSKLLRTVIDVFTYSTVHLPTGDMYVWFYDGNVEYLHRKQVTCTLFLLPYTLALTFIPIIERYSEHNRLLNFLHKKANQIKPMIDAHYAPYKGEWRWWLGARLWLLVVMYSLNPVYSSDKPSLLLSIQATVVILFTIAQARIEPFGQSHQQTDRCTRYTIFCNLFYNCLDLFYLINYIVLALSMSYILLDHSSDQAQMTAVSVGVLVGLYVVVLMVTVLYHLIVAILKACKMYDIAREKINGLFQRKNELIVPIKLDDLTTNTVSTTTVTINYGLREPLCED